MVDPFDIALLTAPGLEALLADEARALNFSHVQVEAGAVVVRGGWSDVRRANYCLRGANRVLVRIARFPAMHLSQLEKEARRIEWGSLLPRGCAFRVEASCRKSKIYHSGAAVERVEKAVSRAVAGVPTKQSDIAIYIRIENNNCVISLDSSGELLHRRGFKQSVAKAPLRETMASLFLRGCGFTGNEPVFDPMCGSGTIPIEAAEMNAGLLPGRARRFAFEKFACHDPDQWADEKKAWHVPRDVHSICVGSDRAAEAVKASQENAARAGVTDWTRFHQTPVSQMVNEFDEAGLVLVNPPYGARLGDARSLRPVYGMMGRILMEKFSGWRVGVITSLPQLAEASGLPFVKNEPQVLHGSLRVRLYQTDILP